MTELSSPSDVYLVLHDMALAPGAADPSPEFASPSGGLFPPAADGGGPGFAPLGLPGDLRPPVLLPDDLNPLLGPGDDLRPPPGPRMDARIRLTRSDGVSDLADPATAATIVAKAAPMPLALIEPVSAAEAGPMASDSAWLAAAQADGVAWGVRAVGADRSRYDGDGVTVAVLDTGIDRGHEAFADPALTVVERDFTGLGDGDGHGHGTHCAGAIFGRPVGGVRIGVAPGVKRALIGKVIGAQAGTEALLDALKWAIDEGADVISMSLGFDYETYRETLARTRPPLAATSEALNAFRDNLRLLDAFMELVSAQSANGRRPIVIAATGNASSRPAFTVSKQSPSASVGVVAVAAAGRDGERLSVAPFSNSDPDLTGPGVSVISARLGGGLTAMSGTSMACPHVAGLAALHWQEIATGPVPRPSAEAVVGALRTSARQRFAEDFSQATYRDVGLGLPHAP